MKAVWKKRWLKALRSGEYEQGRGNLRATDAVTGEDTFCCLGVLCDLAKVKWRGAECKYGQGNLNETGLAFFGLTLDEQDHFVIMNDDDSRSFKQIARSVETRV